MFSQNTILDFEGRRLQGARPFAFCDFADGAWQWHNLRPGLPLQSSANNPVEELRQALHWCRENIGPQGAAIGFFGYEFARALEPKAFSFKKQQLQHRLPLPDARLYFFEELAEESQPAQRKAVGNEPDMPDGLQSDTGPAEYQQAVRAVLDYIGAGDIYQANLTRRFRAPLPLSPAELYGRLLAHPMPFSALLDWDDFAIVSNSPERFLSVKDRTVTAQPIKGTMQRGQTEQDDVALRKTLRESVKDRAENVMIVDLLRNDLGRVCEFGSVTVPKLFEVQTFPTLHHLVSTIQGHLRTGCDAVDAFMAAFPCGSITGAPKIRAMQILQELEPVPRGAAMGAVGYFGFNGDADWNVAIRTVTCLKGNAYFHVGGGIVADSVPESEQEEIAVKAQAIIRALNT